MANDIRDLRRTDWHRIVRRRFIARPFHFNGMTGTAALIAIDGVTEPLTIHSEWGDVTIVEVGYTWLQLAPRKRRIWLTAMFTPEDALLQLYFDITAWNRFDDPDNPTFRDMYLDVVVTPDGTLHPLDRDELDAALAKGDITRGEYDQAVADCEALMDELRRDGAKWIDCCRQTQRALKALLESKG